MRGRRAYVVIAFGSGVAMATFETFHLRTFLGERLPSSLVDWLPAATIAAFTLALYLSHAKHPHVILDGIFAPIGTPDHANSGLFVSNVGDSTAVNIAVAALGVPSFGVSFDPVPFVNVAG